jgi:hypothetical protein
VSSVHWEQICRSRQRQKSQSKQEGGTQSRRASRNSQATQEATGWGGGGLKSKSRTKLWSIGSPATQPIATDASDTHCSSCLLPTAAQGS